MIEVHPPEHTPHSWRDFFLHIATICVGLLIAVGLEQTVEALHHRHQRHELQAQLREEAERNLDLVHINLVRLQHWMDYFNGNIEALNNAPVVNGRIKTSVTIPPGHLFDANLFDPSQAVWTVAKSNGSVALLPEEEAQVYARADHEAEMIEPSITGLVADQVAFLSRNNVQRGRTAAQREWMTTEQRDVMIRGFASASAHAEIVAVNEKNMAGACEGVLHGARSVTEMLQYMGVDESEFSKVERPANSRP